METTTDRQATGRRVRRRRRWGVVVGVAAAVLALSSCTLDVSDGQLQVLCWPDDYDVHRDVAGDYIYTPELPALAAGCPRGRLGYLGAQVADWPIRVTIS